tara:strand:+ start:146983 stop:147342 length:360 start_codon:yes stop_codon:yes gene_type:complete
MNLKKKKQVLQKRRWRVRKKVCGSVERPRLSLSFTHKHMYAQCINDDEGKTLVQLSSLTKDLRSEGLKPNVEGAAKLGKVFGEKCKAAGIASVRFDRGSRRYHGAVKAFAEAARESLTF